MLDLAFRQMTEADWPEVEKIYCSGIATGEATFEPAPPPSWDAFAAGKRQDLMMVAVEPVGWVLGWVAAGQVSTREVYRGVVEHSIYVHDGAAGQGVGSRLLAAFLEKADLSDVWTVQSSVFPSNTASLRLHERAGFRVVGRRERIAQMPVHGPRAGIWRDTLLIERRKIDLVYDNESWLSH